MKNRYRYLAGGGRAAVSLALLLNAAGALAQTGPSPAMGTETRAGSGVEEIVVTAQFREQNLQDTPLAITAVTGEMIEARSQTNISQLAEQAPGVTLKATGATLGPGLGANIRGVGQFDFNPSYEPAVGLYVDDVYYSTLTGSVLDLLDVDRVEILRGPQGTLAGRNSIGGALKIYSKRPEGSNTGTLTATYGSRDRLDLRASADFGLAPGIDMRLAGVAKKQDGYVKRLDFGCVYPAGTSPLNPVGGVPQLPQAGDDCILAKEGEVNYQAIRGQLRLRPSDDIDINIIGDYTHDDRNVAGGVLLQRSFPNGVPASPVYPAPFNPPYSAPLPFPTDVNPYSAPIAYDSRFLCGKYCNFGNFYAPADGIFPTAIANGRTRFEGWGLSGQLDWKLNDDLQLTSITAYRKYTAAFTSDDDLSPLALTMQNVRLPFWSFSQELRLNGSLMDDRLEYTLGGFYMDQRTKNTSYIDLRYANRAFHQADVIDTDSKAAFGHLAYRLIDPLTLTLGIRYTKERKHYVYGMTLPNGAPLPLDGVVSEFKGDRVDYRANLQYEITTDISVYGQFSTGFRGGGVNPRPFNIFQALPFDPEKQDAYEIGLKSDLFGRRVRFNVAAFLSKYKGILLTASNCSAQAGAANGFPCALPVNAGNADIKGIEVETSIRPVEGMIVDGSLTYIDFKYKRFATYTNPLTGAVVSVGGPNNLNGPQFGDYPPFTPKWKWSIGAQYEIGMGNAGSITPRIDASYQGKIYASGANRTSNLIEGYTLANARLTWANTGKDLEISAEVTNLFDKYYLLTIWDLTAPGAGYSTGQPGRPREWALTVKKKF